MGAIDGVWVSLHCSSSHSVTPSHSHLSQASCVMKRPLTGPGMLHSTDQLLPNAWPPQDPYNEPDYTGPAHDFSKDDSPWTYGNGVNPSLEPSNAYRRAQKPLDWSNVPPYHPAYRPPEARDDSGDERQRSSTPSQGSLSSAEYDDPDDDAMKPWDGPRVRRGSEGFEVLEQSREEILRRYIESRGEEVGRYRRYVPADATASEDEDNLSGSPLSAGDSSRHLQRPTTS